MDTDLLEAVLETSGTIRARAADLSEVCRHLMAGTLEEAYALEPPGWAARDEYKSELRRGMDVTLVGDQPQRVTAIIVDEQANQKNLALKKDRFREVGPILIAPTFKDPETGEEKPDKWRVMAFEFETPTEGLTVIAHPLSAEGKKRLADMAQGANAILTTPDIWDIAERGAKQLGFKRKDRSTLRGDDPAEHELFDKYAEEHGLAGPERDEMFNQFMRQDEFQYPEQFLKAYDKVHFSPDRKPHGKEGRHIELVSGPPPALAGVANLEAHDLEQLRAVLSKADVQLEAPVAAKFLPPEKFRVLLGPGLAAMAPGGAMAVESLEEREYPPGESPAKKFDRDIQISRSQARGARQEWEASASDAESLAVELGTVKGFDIKLFGGGNGAEKYLATEAQARGYEMRVGKKAGGGKAVRVRLAETPHFALLAPVNIPGEEASAGVLGLLWMDSNRAKKLQDTGGVRTTLKIPIEVPQEAPNDSMSADQLAMYLYFADEVPGWAYGRSVRGGGQQGRGHGGPAMPGDNAFTILWDVRRIGRLVKEKGIFAIAPSLRGDPATTKDIEAETVKKALEAIQNGKYDIRKSAFHTWIVTIARNTTKSFLERQERRGETTFDPGTVPVATGERGKFGRPEYRLSPDMEELGDSQTFRGALRVLTEREDNEPRRGSSFKTAAAEAPDAEPEERAQLGPAPPEMTPVEPTRGVLASVGRGIKGVWNAAVRDPFLQSGEKQLGAQAEIDRRLAFEPTTQAAQTMTGADVEAELTELETTLKSAKDAVEGWETRVKGRFKDLDKVVNIEAPGWATDDKVLFKPKSSGGGETQVDLLADPVVRKSAGAALVKLVVDGVLGVQMTGQFTYLMEDLRSAFDGTKEIAVYMLGVPSEELQGAEVAINTADRKFSELEQLAPKLLQIDKFAKPVDDESVQAYKALFAQAVRAVGLLLGALGNAVDRLTITVGRARKVAGTKLSKNQRFIRRFAKPQADLGIGPPTASLTPTDERVVSDVFQRYMTQYTGLGQYRGEMVWPWDADALTGIRAQFKDRGITDPSAAQMQEIQRRIELDMDDRITYYISQVFRDAGKTAELGLPDILEAFGKEELPVRDPTFRTRVARTLSSLVTGGYLEGAGEEQSPYGQNATYQVYKATPKLATLVKSYKR